MNKKYFKSGSALVYALVIMGVVSVLFTSILQFVVSQIKYSDYFLAKQQSLQIAEAGLNYYRWYLAHHTYGKTSQEIKEFWDNTSPYPQGFEENPLLVEYFDAQGRSLGWYRVEATDPTHNYKDVMITISGWTNRYPDMVRKIRTHLVRFSWSDYVLLTNQAASYDEKWDIHGKIMSNTGVHFDGVAHSLVTAGSASYYDVDSETTKPGIWTSWGPNASAINTYVNPDSKVFLAGYRYPVAQKDFAGVSVDLNMMKVEATKPNGATLNGCTSTGCYFDGSNLGRRIEFVSGDRFKIWTVETLTNNSNEVKKETQVTSGDGYRSSDQTFAIPNEGVIYVNGSIWISGTINDRRVTVVAARLPYTGVAANFYIGYANLKYTNYDGRDVLGLVSQGDIELSSANIDDLEIDAAILAQNGGVYKPDYNPNCCGIGCEENKNNIDIYGSVISNRALAFSWTKSCNPAEKVGYLNKKITYDNNLLYNAPPFFPSDSFYALDLWEEIE